MNIFIIFTAYQYKCVQDIIIMNNFKNNILISTIKIKRNTFSGKIYYFKKINTFKLLFGEIIHHKRKNIFMELQSKYKYQDNIQLYFAHYFNIHANYCANTLFPHATVNIIPDGILSFYPYMLSTKNKVKQVGFKLISFLLGSRYKMFFKNIVDPFGDVRFIYSYEPKLTYVYSDHTKIIKIKNYDKPTNIEIKYDSLLVLGTTHNVDNITSKIIDFIKKYKINNVYYKKHPNAQKDNVYTELASMVHTVELLSGDISAEKCVELYGMGNIISVEFSTALIEIQRLYSNKLNCYANTSLIFHNNDNIDFFRSILKFYNIKNF